MFCKYCNFDCLTGLAYEFLNIMDDKCRICLSNRNLTNLFHNTNSDQICDKIMSLASISIQSNDGLPTSICRSCIKKLEICLEFIELCKTTDCELRNSLISVKTESPSSDVKKSDLSLNENITKLSPAPEGEGKIEGDGNEVIKSGVSNSLCDLNVHGKVTQKQQCFTCGKIMSSRFRLKTHLATHTGEKPHSCPHCNKKFTIAQNLNVHIRIHTGEKPFRCSTCGESFAQSSGLTAHKRKHTGQKPYPCVLCPRSFRTIGHLQYHVRRHTGEKNFECDTCSRAFITRSDLKQHLKTHIGDKPHICCICGMRLSRASNLKRHMKYSHSEGKSFICSDCPSKFVRKSDLLKHEKKHKSIENK